MKNIEQSVTSPGDINNAPRDNLHPETTTIVGTSDEVLDISFLLAEMVSKWWLILACLLVGGYMGVRDAHNFSGVYIAQMVVAPVGKETENPSGGTAGVVSALAGLNIRGAEKITKFDRLVFSTSTLTLAKILDQKYHLMDRIYGAGFDRTTQTWIRPEGTRFEYTQKLNAFLNLPTWKPPTIEDLANKIGGSFKVVDPKKSFFKRISFSHKDPKEALELLEIVYKEAEFQIKERERKEQAGHRQFLEERYSETNITEFQMALAEMMAQQARQEMMTHDDLPSVARIVDPPFVSKYKTEPNLLVLLALPIMSSLGFGVGIVLLLALFRRE